MPTSISSIRQQCPARNNHLTHAGAMLYASLVEPYFANLAKRLDASMPPANAGSN